MKHWGQNILHHPYMVEGQRPGDADYETILENMRHIGKEAQALGIQMLYHNHEFEFERQQGVVYGVFWREKREGRNAVIKL